jgi:catechol 2,3-dioxygenase-like lactoylglutathione lyase family enzyme
MEQRLSLVTLGVADLARSARFYEDGLGWRRGTDDEGVVFFQMPGMVLSLYPRAALAEDVGVAELAPAPAAMTLAYNARSRDEVDKVMAKAVASGAALVKAAKDAFWGGYSGYFADPDEHLWEVAFNPFWEIDEQGGVKLNA